MKIQRDKLLTSISKKTGVERAAVKIVLDMFQSQVADHLKKGNTVYLSGFGVFMLRHWAGRKQFNPDKRKRYYQPSHSYPVLKFSKKLKETIKKLTVVAPPDMNAPAK